MKIDVSHSKNPAMGWDVVVEITPDPEEQVSFVDVKVNGFTKVSRINTDIPKAVMLRYSINAVGVYPGDNTVKVIAYDQDNEQFVAIDQWN